MTSVYQKNLEIIYVLLRKKNCEREFSVQIRGEEIVSCIKMVAIGDHVAELVANSLNKEFYYISQSVHKL